jgi:hypothetical protein
MQKEHKIVYTAPGPSCDYNRDGKLDLFLANWWVDSRSLLLKNETQGGHWLDVSIEGPKGVNRQGIGAVVRIYPAGKLGDAKSLLWPEGNRRRLRLCLLVREANCPFRPG